MRKSHFPLDCSRTLIALLDSGTRAMGLALFHFLEFLQPHTDANHNLGTKVIFLRTCIKTKPHRTLVSGVDGEYTSKCRTVKELIK